MKIMIDKIDNYNDIDYLNFFSNIKLEKRNRINKLLNPIRKKESLLGEKLFIDNLHKIYEIDYSKIEIKYTRDGKPYINHNNNIYYNISHSHGIVVIVFNSKPIGIDIEKIRATNINVINQISTENEKEYILKEKDFIYERIFKIYTLKEAYFKMKGTNLSNIQNVEFIVNDDSNISCSDKNISILQFNNIKNYIISVCFYN